ncbi:MAG: tRNA (adenosine(37)-N6)-threonylcarbamoyltransferase complex ATPase subunit type 1 TsaE [Verrucomicrobia bacterium]|nr:tRNA (adenosine(37)-N6)-threonylcarbamoyltransferase complex ATPase subunit type 1 TsaE [Verrucomicrobiota bacterium]
MATLISPSPEATRALGVEWGRGCGRGWVFALSGDLGAGKTELVKGIAAGLGVTARVSSPSFALVNEYAGGRLPLFHLDLYRLDTPAQIIGAGLEEYLFNPAGVTVVEWAERWLNNPAAGATGKLRRVNIEVLGEVERRITWEDVKL